MIFVDIFQLASRTVSTRFLAVCHPRAQNSTVCSFQRTPPEGQSTPALKNHGQKIRDAIRFLPFLSRIRGYEPHRPTGANAAVAGRLHPHTGWRTLQSQKYILECTVARRTLGTVSIAIKSVSYHCILTAFMNFMNFI